MKAKTMKAKTTKAKEPKSKASKLGSNVPSFTPTAVNLVAAITEPSRVLRMAGSKGKRPGQTQLTFFLPDELAERLKNAGYWERTTAHAITTAAIEAELDRREKANNKGKPYGPRVD